MKILIYSLFISLCLSGATLSFAKEFKCQVQMKEEIPILNLNLLHPEEVKINPRKEIPSEYIIQEHIYNDHLLTLEPYERKWALATPPHDGNISESYLIYYTEIYTELPSFSFKTLAEDEGEILLNIDGEERDSYSKYSKSTDLSTRSQYIYFNLRIYQKNDRIIFSSFLNSKDDAAQLESMFSIKENYNNFILTAIRKLTAFDVFTYMSQTSIALECKEI